MVKISEQGQKIENFRDSVRNARETVREIAAALENEKLPDSILLDKLVEIFRNAEKLESEILSGWDNSLQKGTVSDYINHLNKFSNEDQLKTWIETLNKFTRIYSDDPDYNNSIDVYRNEASKKIEDLKLIKDSDAVEEIKEQIDFYLLFVKLLEAGDDDFLLETLSDKISGKIYRGLVGKKYRFRQTDDAANKVTPNGIIILHNINFKFDVKIFKRHMENIDARPALILSCATWLIYFTAEEMIRLLIHFQEEKHPDDAVKTAIESLVAKGYLTSFKLSERDSTRYALCSNLKNAFANENNRKILNECGNHVTPAMKGLTINLFSLTKAEVTSVEERNKAFLDAIDFISKNSGEQAAHDLIITPLNCTLSCFFTGQEGAAILSGKMLQSLAANPGETGLYSFLQKNEKLLLLLSDINSSEEAKSLVESRLPERKYKLLPEFCNIIKKEEANSGPQEKRYPPAAVQAKELEIPDYIKKEPSLNADKDLKTPEEIAKILAAIDIHEDEARFTGLCDMLADKLSDNPFKKDDNGPDRIIQALVFLYALASGQTLALCKHLDVKEKERIKNKSIQVQLAAGLFLDDIHYDSDTLGKAFPDIEATPQKISAFMRAMFSPYNQKDYDLYVLGDQLAERMPGTPLSYKSFKKILKDLTSLKTTERGFSSAVLNCFADQTTIQRKNMEIVQKAAGLKIVPKIKASINGKTDFTEFCFGKNSELYQIMESIEKGDNTIEEMVRFKVDELDDSKKLDAYIDKIWSQVKSQNQGINLPKLENAARKKMVNEFEKRTALMKEWLEHSGREKVNISQEIRNLRNTLLEEIPKTIDAIETEPNGSLFIYESLKYILTALKDGRTPDQTWAFSEFLYSFEVELNDNNKPTFPEFFESLPGMEAWRSVARHICEQRLPLSDVLKRIKKTDDLFYFDNLNHGKKIEEFLILNRKSDPENRIPWDKNETGARENSNSQEGKLIAEMELAFAYGRIEEQEKESLLSLEKEFNQYFQKCLNFGHFHFILTLFRNLLEKHENAIRDKLEKRFENRPEADKKCCLAQEIQKLIKKANFNVAEEYINLLDSGKQELPTDQGYDEKDFFNEYINLSNNLSELCRKHKGTSIRGWGLDNLMLNPVWSNWSSRQKDSSRNLLINWPAMKQDTTTGNIKAFFIEIGFSVEDVRRKHNDQYLIFELQVKPPDRNQQDYRHPIADFGTGMQIVDVICLFGGHAVGELINIIVRDLHLGANSIVIYDNAILLADRRKLIEDFHNNTSGQNSFILIDQILGLYLATLDISERIPAMLKTTLPFSSCQPFNPGSGIIPDEMFFGRKTELKEILYDKGTNFVYGGRQLGKTALLLRARSMAHRPDRGEYAIYVEVKAKTPDETVPEIYSKIQDAKIPIVLPNVGNWESLCHWIQSSFNKGKTKKLLLLIDEADTFLEFDRKDNFKAIGVLINLRRNTNNHFKFVFAGLHNVARSRDAIERNGIFPQMPPPLCIRPLSPADARNLLKRPLSYLGFKMDHLQQIELILANTNYYPGILHFFGHILIKTVLFEQYRNYYNSDNHPPYDLTDKQLRRIFSNNQLNNQIKEKINITLALDPRYKILANIIAYQYYLDEGKETDRSKGYTVEKIHELGRALDVGPEEEFVPENITNLLSEMADMGILWKNDDEKLFRLRRGSFLGTIGLWEEVDKNIAELNVYGFRP